ncbi:P-loop containing nucleoside triphosphate hydrolase protein [Cercophora newfieldiana]|uniref:P-loop containing nucleoside triphosphate hydrolase protein n=1 Tax=Cercophora newfieldiana TaxID=92897 RepID=A0AA39Y0J9_9PEZI|nr:P-loop containing nucleoside triphosphate hydrolase protein [Cercophora newfieldiana]
MLSPSMDGVSDSETKSLSLEESASLLREARSSPTPPKASSASSTDIGTGSPSAKRISSGSLSSTTFSPSRLGHPAQNFRLLRSNPSEAAAEITPSAASSSTAQHASLISTAAGTSPSTTCCNSRLSFRSLAFPSRNIKYALTSNSSFVPIIPAISLARSGPSRPSPSYKTSFSTPSHTVIPTCDSGNIASVPQPVPNPSPLQLRNYQEECIQSVLASLENGHKRLGISLATGSGKTVIFTQLIDRVKPLSETATQTLILAHRRELVEQAARHCSSIYPDKKIELELGKLSATGTADITVASVQSITSQDRLYKFDPSRFKLILVDEAHHIVAPNYLKVLDYLGLDSKRPDSPHLVGVSATFSRTDGVRLGAAIDEIVYHKDYIDMIGDKWLSDVIFTTVESKADLSAVKRTGRGGSGEFDIASLSRAVNTDDINEITIKSWFAKAAGRKSTLVFCVDLAHVASLTQKFRHHGVDARFVTGDTPTRERSERLEAFKKGEFPVLVNCGVFTEGTDIPNIDCVLLARPTRSRSLLIQMIGRGMRLYPGKENCHIIDMVSALEAGIVTTPTLFGLDPSELVNNASVKDMEELRERKEAEKERKSQVERPVSGAGSTRRSHSVTFTDYDSVFDLVADTSGEKHIRAVSRNAWVMIGPNRYMLNGVDGSFLRLEKAEAEDASSPVWNAWDVRSLPVASKTPWAAPRKILDATTFVDAVHGCDNFASSAVDRFPHHYVDSRAGWRKKPPTHGQLAFLNKMLAKISDPVGPDDITKGQAANMITKLKFGARSRFADLSVEKRRRQKQNLLAEIEQAMRQGNHLGVGPVLS